MTSKMQEEMQDFIEDVDDVCKKVDDILNDRVPVEELKKQEAIRLRSEARRKKEEALEREAAAERERRILYGREGPGDKENYSDYCVRCKVEFERSTEVCPRCSRKTISQAKRKEDLLIMVKRYQEAKQRKQDRKQKWEMWKKTKAMFWKKSTTDYDKWEYFTDSEDEFEEAEKRAPAVVPENDPNFKAMEADLEQRSRDRKRRAKEANEFKKEGNQLLKKKLYGLAIEKYSKGIDLFRQNKFLWSNRALAYLKLKKFEEAIKDCSDMLEYADVLDGGYAANKDINFKFFARRSMGYIGLKKYKEALEDIDEALKLIPDDPSALETRKEILEKLEGIQKLEDLEKKLEDPSLTNNFSDAQLKSKEAFESWVKLAENLSNELIKYDYFQLKDFIKDKDLKMYLFKKKGLMLAKKIFKKNLYTVTSSQDRLNFLTFFKFLAEAEPFIADEMVDIKLVRNIISEIFDDLKKLFPNNVENKDNKQALQEEGSKMDDNEEELSEEAKARQAETIQQMYDYHVIKLEELLEFLITLTEHRPVRAYLREKGHLFIPIFNIFQENLFPKFEKEMSLLSSTLSFFSNLCMNDVGIKNVEIREHFTQNHLAWIYQFSSKVLAKPQRKYLCLKNSCLAFLVNLSTDKRLRDHTVTRVVTFEGLNKDKKNVTVNSTDLNHVAYFMQTLGVCFNLLYKKTVDGDFKNNEKELIMKFYEHSTGMLLNLFFQLTDKGTVNLLQTHFKRWNLDSVCIEILHNCLKYKLNMGILLNRFINVVSKLSFESNPENNKKMTFILGSVVQLFSEDNNENKDFFTDAIRFIASMLQSKKEVGKEVVEKVLFSHQPFLSHIKKIIELESSSTMR